MKRLPKTEENIQKPCKSVSPEPANLLGNIEKIVELSENSELSNEFFEKAVVYINFVKATLQLSDMATVFFAIFVDNIDSRYICIDDLSKYLNCRNIRILKYMDSLNELEKRHLVRCHRKDNTPEYRIPKEVIKALTEGKKIEPRLYTNISQDEFFVFLNELFEEKK